MAVSEAVPAPTSARPRAGRAEDIIIAAKITTPGLPRWVVSRPRLDARIRDGIQGPLTLVSGPPGAGKTMAIASWAASAGRCPISWVTLDEYDNHPRAFWSYVVAALRRAGVDIPKALWSSARGRIADHAFILRLTAAITTRGSPVVLVLDDLHLVTDQRSLSGLAQLLRNARPHLRLVAASRLDPLLPLHRYRLAGELTEIRADELAFDVAEAGLLIEHHGVALSAESVEFLTARTGGWVAALRLATISMTAHPDPAQFVKEVAAEDGAVAAYLVDEVLSTLPADVRQLLLRTSILDRVSADLARELADDRAGIDLASVAQANAFVQPLGGGWYRYHPLLAEVMRLKLRRELPDLVPDLHRQAARWLGRHGALAEAVRHARAADDWPLAARTAVDELAVDQLVEPYHGGPLADVLGRMPRGRAWTEPPPWLVTAALGLAGESPETVGAALVAAADLLARIPPDEELPSRLAEATIRLILARRTGDYRTAEAAAAAATALVDKMPAGLLARHPEAHAQVRAGSGSVQFWSGHFDQAAATLAAAAAEEVSGHQLADCLGRLALLEMLRGRLVRGSELAAQATGADMDGVAKPEVRSSSAGLVALAYLHLERHELPAARRWLRLADEALRLCPDKLAAAVACLAAARACLAEGRFGPVPDLVDRALLGWSAPPWLEHRLRLVESRALARAGRTQDAVAAARRVSAGRPAEVAAALAGAWLAAGDVPAAQRALADGTTRAPDHGCLEAWLVDAWIGRVTGDGERSHRALAHALRLAEPEQRRLPFFLEQDWLRGELPRHPDLAPAYRDLLGPGPLARPVTGARKKAPARKSPPAARQQPGAGAVVPLVVDELSEREREVLQYAAQLLGTAEIAAEMFVSVNTVKSHLKSIFRKLGAASRNEAVRRARQLELV